MSIEIRSERGGLRVAEPAGPLRWSGFAFVAAAVIGGWVSDVGWHAWAAAVIAAAGVLAMLHAAHYEIGADSRHKLLRLERRSPMATQSVSLPFAEVTAIEFVTNTNRVSDGATTYLIRIRRAKGDPLRASSCVSWGRENKRAAAEQLARVVGVPLVELAID